MAHRVALASSGQTVAFLAGRVDRFYPTDTLLTRIVEAGAVVSELPCGSPPTKWRFLRSNQKYRRFRNDRDAHGCIQPSRSRPGPERSQRLSEPRTNDETPPPGSRRTERGRFVSQNKSSQLWRGSRAKAYAPRMGASLPFYCPIEGCNYSTTFRLGMGEEADPKAHAERVEILREEHPAHPLGG